MAIQFYFIFILLHSNHLFYALVLEVMPFTVFTKVCDVCVYLEPYRGYREACKVLTECDRQG